MDHQSISPFSSSQGHTIASNVCILITGTACYELNFLQMIVSQKPLLQGSWKGQTLSRVHLVIASTVAAPFATGTLCNITAFASIELCAKK